MVWLGIRDPWGSLLLSSQFRAEALAKGMMYHTIGDRYRGAEHG
jgi:hypothetical protein